MESFFFKKKSKIFFGVWLAQKKSNGKKGNPATQDSNQIRRNPATAVGRRRIPVLAEFKRHNSTSTAGFRQSDTKIRDLHGRFEVPTNSYARW